ncbi:pectinesterase family protein [Pedobacter mucosus]|uniref:pectinesterase family protein n=1 Tax=Pedobacter mucosus TaxID=2895286 RepID=UPI001EE44183|nr:pectinesterase family protein [Pedobacter mucosus]UKT63705.1 pectinesterase family protein [Pedobacter mucosus]
MNILLRLKSLTVLFLVGFSLQAVAQDPKYPSEITVSKDGKGNYKTIQEAINSVRDLGEKTVKIFIKNGTYNEKLIVPSWKTKISLIGESKDKTIITFDDYSGKINPKGNDLFGMNKFSTYTSYTVLIQADDTILQNLTIINASGKVGQAVALHVEGDRFIADDCNILGNQDTLFATEESSRQYYKSCFIEGTTDFIFGKATALFQDCTIKSLSNSYVTAAATSSRQKFGFVFLNCKLIADSTATKVYLGRPWRPFAKTVFINCDLGKHILPEGWNPWKGDTMFPDKEKTVFYAEYKNSGAGASAKTRLPWTKQLTNKEIKTYTVQNILGGNDHWNQTTN